jgi:hypothetical protein
LTSRVGACGSADRDDKNKMTLPASIAPPPAIASVALLAWRLASSRRFLPAGVQAFGSSTRHCVSDCCLASYAW